MATAQTRQASKASRDVMVFLGAKDCIKQPQTFRLCPLGLQFYSPKRLNEFDLMEFTIDVPDKGHRTRTQKCIGAVVRCQREEKNYRVWVKFIDLPRTASENIRCISKKGNHLCCYCENF
ncbi:MAG: PilZ domain-containing protein [bacterium]